MFVSFLLFIDDLFGFVSFLLYLVILFRFCYVSSRFASACFVSFRFCIVSCFTITRKLVHYIKTKEILKMSKIIK